MEGRAVNLSICRSALAASALAVITLQAQTFEVASVKPSTPGAKTTSLRTEPGGRFTGIGLTLENYVTIAFNVRPDQLIGAPDWIKSTAYDIIAKPTEPVSDIRTEAARKEQMARLQSLLADRFELKFHRGSEQRQVLALTIAGNGLKIPEVKPGGACPPGEGPGQIVSMKVLASELSPHAGETVLDQTGVAGSYCVRLKWTSEAGRELNLGLGRSAAKDAAITDPADGPSLISALREQLGLKLQRTKADVETLTIDHIGPASAN
jgi:uncharacterized protein (TIGR03435 family)